jgi:cobalamin-dependent methionine synthase I
MILIGENLNVMSKRLAEAFRNRNPEPIRKMVEAEMEAGMDMLDLNRCPAALDKVDHLSKAAGGTLLNRDLFPAW